MTAEQPGPWDATARDAYVSFIEQYRAASALEGSPQALEAAWLGLGLGLG